MSWKKRILLDTQTQEQICQHLPEEYKVRLKDQVFRMRMLLAEFEILVDTNEELKELHQEIIAPFKTKRNIAKVELDMDGKMVIAVHQGDPLSPFSRAASKKDKQVTTKQKKETSKKKEPQKPKTTKKAAPQSSPKRGFMKTAPAISMGSPNSGSQFVDEGLSSLFGEDIPPPQSSADTPIERFAPPPKTPPRKVRLRFDDSQNNTTSGKIGSGPLENLVKEEMQKINQRRPWEED